MDTVFSHIVQKRLSQENENVATEALAFILESSEAARVGLMSLLREFCPGLPTLRFRTQETDGSARPDMWGFDGKNLRVLVENKFWAGLTDNQPLTYLQTLSRSGQSSVLLVVVPRERLDTVHRELVRRLEHGGIAAEQFVDQEALRCFTTSEGPILALTSWQRLLSAIDAHLSEEPKVRSDLLQLQALCGAADSEAFIPLSSEQLTDQVAPRLILDLNMIWNQIIELGVAEGLLTTKKLMPQADYRRTGRYFSFPGREADCGAWLGVEFMLWKREGVTPIWMVFSFGAGSWGAYARAAAARLAEWAERSDVPFASRRDSFALGIRLVTGEEKDAVVRSALQQVRAIARALQ